MHVRIQTVEEAVLAKRRGVFLWSACLMLASQRRFLPPFSTPMFDARTYATRRSTLADRVPSGLLLFLGNQESPKNYPDNPYPFRQDSSFLYYFGIDTPGLAGVVDADAGTTTLYGDDPDLDAIVWMGPQPTMAEYVEQTGADQRHGLDDLHEHLRTAIRQGRRVHVLPPYRDVHRQWLQSLLGIRAVDVNDYASDAFIDAVIAQRSHKSPAEVEEIEEAVAATAAMHEHAMSRAVPGVTEREIYGEIAGLAQSQGRGFSFLPTCSVRGEVLHNHHYDNTLVDGDLLLVDAGATSAMHYAGDVTRVSPVGGSFNERQQAVYQAVLDAQVSAIERMKPGVPFKDVHLHSATLLTERLQSIGLMKGDVETSVEEGAHALFFPHGLGHMMGLDVHDMEGLGEDRVGYAEDQHRSEQFGLNALRMARPLEPGHVVTVEPGCYFIPELIRRWKAERRHDAFINYDRVDDFHDFGGIRIEDDVLVTDTGARVLGPGIPKSVDAVEAMTA